MAHGAGFVAGISSPDVTAIEVTVLTRWVGGREEIVVVEERQSEFHI